MAGGRTPSRRTPRVNEREVAQRLLARSASPTALWPALTLARLPRYNLLREANEGYAKAVTLLNSAGGQPGAPGAAPLGPFVSELRALIGFFSLDPNRWV